MTDQIAIMLGLFANYSNFYSVLSVLVCFCAMVVFILRLNGDHLMGNSATHYNVVKEQKMVSLHNPFSVQLQGSRTSSLAAGIHIDMSVTKPASACIFWGVNIQAFQKELNKTTQDIAADFREKRLFENRYLHMLDIESLSPEDGLYQIHDKCPDTVTEDVLGAPPRQAYPVLLVSLLTDWDVPLDFTAIVVQFTVFHLKDSICRLDSHLVYQFVKTNHNRVLSLQPIFVVSSDPDTPTAGSNSNSSQFGSNRTQENVTNLESNSSHTSSVNERIVLDHSCDSCRCTDTDSNNQDTHQSTVDTVCDCASRMFDEGKCQAVLGESGSVKDTKNQDRNGISVEESVQDNDDYTGNRNGINQEESVLDTNDQQRNDVFLEEGNSCIVCQSDVIFYTLLPCRHACVCGSCIKQLDRCPMCRGYIDTYFRLHNTSYSTVFPLNTDTLPEAPALGRWQALNERLNELLGFS